MNTQAERVTTAITNAKAAAQRAYGSYAETAPRTLIEAVEFDVNVRLGQGGNGGLTSDATTRAAGELRVIVARTKRKGGER